MEDELELLGDNDYFTDLYDQEKGKWRFAREGDFWEAVARAQAAGLDGKGAKYAVIDGGFDLTVPELQANGKLRQGVSRQGGAGHGTTVAMLMLAVAPGLQLDLYDVVDERGKPSVSLLRQAVEAVQATDVTVVNMSLGAPVKKGWFSQLFARTHPPGTCDLAATLLPDKVVVAAVGNQAGRTYCPAANPGVVAIGFQTESRSLMQDDDGNSNETASFAEPTYSQAAGANYTLIQPAGVLGSSFATPLVTAATALLAQPKDLLHYADASTIAGGVADQHRAFLAGRLAKEDRKVVAQTYLDALKKLPHHHAPGEGFCFGCSAFAGSVYTNAGLFHSQAGDRQLGVALLRTATELLPWSPHPFAGLGASYLTACQDLTVPTPIRLDGATKAVHYYQKALDNRPGFPLYQQLLREAKGLQIDLRTRNQQEP